MSKSYVLDARHLPDAPPPESLPGSLAERPYFFLLDSSLGGRYSIAAWEPREVIESREGSSFLEEFRKRLASSPRIDAPDLPFAGGWIGYLGYELHEDIESKVAPRTTRLAPKAVMAFYDQFYLYDHKEKKAYWIEVRPGEAGADRGPPERNAKRPAGDSRLSGSITGRTPAERLSALFASRSGGLRTAPPASGTLKSNFSHAEYLAAIRRAKDYIAAGDCYQVNLSQRFTMSIHQSATDIYQRLRFSSPSPYAAFLNLGDTQILSSSPESFLEINGREIVTRPIKGTRPRGMNTAADAAFKEQLLASPKDRAELLMITDLERNDLGRICKTGSVRVRELRTVETFPQVHHLASTIEGELIEGKDIVDVIRAMFPGGSITGAPKIRGMQVIRELEPHAREVYCGTIGFVGLNGKAQFNVAIRTMVVKDGTAHFWSGGGIVADSDPEAEYEETLIKAEGLRKSLGD